MTDLDQWDGRGERHEVVEQGGGLEPAVRRVPMRFVKHLADAHGDPAANLPVDYIRVDDPAAVLHSQVTDHPGDEAVRVDLDRGQVRAARINLRGVVDMGHVGARVEVTRGHLAQSLENAGGDTDRSPRDEGAAALGAQLRVA